MNLDQLDQYMGGEGAGRMNRLMLMAFKAWQLPAGDGDGELVTGGAQRSMCGNRRMPWLSGGKAMEPQ